MMYDKLIKGIYRYGKKTIKRQAVKNSVEYTARAASEDVNDFAKDWLDIGYANPADEDKYMREYGKKKPIPVPPQKPDMSKSMPMQREVTTWSKEDLDNVMQSKDYQYDETTQKKVKSYFENKYSSKQKLDATGRPY